MIPANVATSAEPKATEDYPKVEKKSVSRKQRFRVKSSLNVSVEEESGSRLGFEVGVEERQRGLQADGRSCRGRGAPQVQYLALYMR